jgi:hypothetical protein
VGVIIPVYEITKDKANYFRTVCIVCLSILVTYIFFGEFLLFTYYNKMILPDAGPLITDYIPQDSPIVWTIKILFVFNLIVSYPLVIYPSNMIVESYLYEGWPKSKKRQCCKNVNRAVVVALTCIVALAVWN